MPFEIIDEKLNGLKLLRPKVFNDERGYFYESFKKSDFQRLGINAEFIQDNHSKSQKGILRGMHFQFDEAQGKLLRVSRGSAQVVEVDIRKNSPTFKQWVSFDINDINKHILWIPPGFANGFLALSETVEVQYKVTAYWNPKGESSIAYNDPDLNIKWEIEKPHLSPKDAEAQHLSQWIKNPNSNKLIY